MQSVSNTSAIKNDSSYSDTIYYGVYMPNDAKDYNASPYVFQDKSEALKLAKRNKKSRFKAFQFYHEAAEFALNGSECPNNNPTLGGLFSSKVTESTQTIGEKSSPFKGPKPQELVELRKAIETGNFKYVKETIWQNPRYLVSNGDTPSILQEGPRYNALHVAAKSKNADIAELILSTVSNTEFVKLLYGDDNQQNAEDRTAVLLDLYLNTPNKGLNETPLHFASKHGAVEVVELLVSYPQCDRVLRNKFHKTAVEVICERAEGNNIQAVKHKIQLLLQDSYYVPVLRAEDNSVPPTVGEPFSPMEPPVLNKDPLSPRMEIHAYAGPMDKKGAQEFRRVWKTPPRTLSYNSSNKKNDNVANVSSLRFKDPDKGLERIGKKLAEEYDVSWKEYWPFLGNFVDIASEEGLNLLENYFCTRFMAQNISYDSDTSSKDLDVSKSDPLSPISDLCSVFSACKLNDSWTGKMDAESLSYIDKACQVFANRISNDILYVLCNEDNIVQVLEVEIKQLEYLITSYMEDTRFSLVNFQKIHSRLGCMVGQKLYNNIKEEARVLLCSKIEGVLDAITKSVDCFSSDDEGHSFKEFSENRKPTIYKKQLICLIHYILNVLSQTFEAKCMSGDGDSCLREWEEAETCLCVYHIRKSKKNSLSRSGSFKNSTRSFLKNEAEGRLVRRLKYDDIDCDQSIVKNSPNVSVGSIIQLDLSSEEDEDFKSEDVFYTPPSTPSLLEDLSDSEDFVDTELPKYDVFIESDFPTKLDCDVFNAICYADVALDRDKYPSIYKWYHSVSLYPKDIRERWSHLKEPKTQKHSSESSVNSSFCTSSPKSTARSWLRVTGANSPKTVLHSPPSRCEDPNELIQYLGENI